jgi:hypothetical protein
MLTHVLLFSALVGMVGSSALWAAWRLVLWVRPPRDPPPSAVRRAAAAHGAEGVSWQRLDDGLLPNLVPLIGTMAGTAALGGFLIAHGVTAGRWLGPVVGGLCLGIGLLGTVAGLGMLRDALRRPPSRWRGLARGAWPAPRVDITVDAWGDTVSLELERTEACREAVDEALEALPEGLARDLAGRASRGELALRGATVTRVVSRPDHPVERKARPVVWLVPGTAPVPDLPLGDHPRIEEVVTWWDGRCLRPPEEGNLS